MRHYLFAPFAVIALVLGACAPSYTGGARALEPSAVTDDWTAVRSLPPHPQRAERDCGAAAMASVLSFWGQSVDVAAIDRAIRAPQQAGARAGALRDYARERGMRAFLIRGQVSDLVYELEQGRPVIVGTLKRYGERTAYEHYEVVFAVSPGASTIATYDPANGWRRYQRSAFLSEWKPSGNLALVVLPPTAARN